MQDEIQRNEERVLAELPPAERAAFLRAAGRLSALPVARILAGPPANGATASPVTAAEGHPEAPQ